MGRVDVLNSVDEGAESELDIRNQMGDNAVRMYRAVDEVGRAVVVVVVDWRWLLDELWQDAVDEPSTSLDESHRSSADLYARRRDEVGEEGEK